MANSYCIPETLPDDSRDGWYCQECDEALEQINAIGALLRALPSGGEDGPFAPAPVPTHAMRAIGRLIMQLADRATAALPPAEGVSHG
ncbi:MAG TPA: hypothetical protein PJ986_04560 [Gammaproteobacteria bacterium]|nr:hypothetical protein [Gammaproteobacteria bacterium]